MERYCVPVWKTRLYLLTVSANWRPHRYRYGLFAIDVLAGFNRVNCYQRVPMVRRNYNHGINVISSQQIAIIIISGAALISSAGAFCGVGFLDAALAFFTPHTIHVTYS